MSPSIHLSRTRHEAQLRFYRRMMSHAPLRKMMARQGIDLAGGWWRGFEEMIFRACDTCARCPFKPLCKTWLEQAPARYYPWFCPNTHIIEACRILDPDAPPLSREDRQVTTGEPPLAEVIADPIVKQLMRADGVPDGMLPASR